VRCRGEASIDSPLAQAVGGEFDVVEIVVVGVAGVVGVIIELRGEACITRSFNTSVSLPINFSKPSLFCKKQFSNNHPTFC
jgi:hypothetical protein